MIPGAYVHVFCSKLQFTLWYKSLVLKKREERASGREDSEESGCERKQNKLLGLRLSFESENTALHYIRAVGIWQQITALLLAAHTTMIEMTILCWQANSRI